MARAMFRTGWAITGGALAALATIALTPSGYLAQAQAKDAGAKSGDVLIAGGVSTDFKSTNVAEIYKVATKKFTIAAHLQTGRVGVIGETLTVGTPKDGILVAGGLTGMGDASKPDSRITVEATDLRTAEIYDPASGKFQATESLVQPRVLYSETRLGDGTVLIAGGYDPTLGTPVATAEIFNPKTGKFASTKGAMTKRRAIHTATLLDDGEVLIVGGLVDNGDTTTTAELYDPKTGKFTATKGDVTIEGGVAGHTATLIAGCGCARDGEVLIAGGFNGMAFNHQDGTVNGTSLYDPATGKFSSAGLKTMVDDRQMHTATAIGKGRVLIAGGSYGYLIVNAKVLAGGGDGGGFRDSAEIFDPVTATFTCVGGETGTKTKSCKSSMTGARGGHSATLLSTGEVLLAGGLGQAKVQNVAEIPLLKTAEIFDPKTDKFTAVGSMSVPHALHAAATIE
jgi:hypothetical protein